MESTLKAIVVFLSIVVTFFTPGCTGRSLHRRKRNADSKLGSSRTRSIEEFKNRLALYQLVQELDGGSFRLEADSPNGAPNPKVMYETSNGGVQRLHSIPSFSLEDYNLKSPPEGLTYEVQTHAPIQVSREAVAQQLSRDQDLRRCLAIQRKFLKLGSRIQVECIPR